MDTILFMYDFVCQKASWRNPICDITYSNWTIAYWFQISPTDGLTRNPLCFINPTTEIWAVFHPILPHLFQLPPYTIVLSTWCHVISSWCFSSLTDKISARQYTGGSVKSKEWGQGSDLPGSWDTPAFWRYRSKGHLGFPFLDLHMNVSHTHKHFKWYVCKQSSTYERLASEQIEWGKYKGP